MKAGIVEIQGEVIHGSGAVLDHDAKRMTALQSMGYDVFLVTHDMLNDAEQLDAIVRSLCSRLELRYRCKTKAQKDDGNGVASQRTVQLAGNRSLDGCPVHFRRPRSAARDAAARTGPSYYV